MGVLTVLNGSVFQSWLFGLGDAPSGSAVAAPTTTLVVAGTGPGGAATYNVQLGYRDSLTDALVATILVDAPMVLPQPSFTTPPTPGYNSYEVFSYPVPVPSTLYFRTSSDIAVMTGAEMPLTLYVAVGYDGGNGAVTYDYTVGYIGSPLFSTMLDTSDTATLGTGADYIVDNDGSVTVDGGNGSDTIYTFGEGADLIKGGNGNDTIAGGLGRDTLTGNAGADIFVFLSINDDDDGRDRITDFSQASGARDLIDLTAIDANTLTGADDAFVLTSGGGTGRFTGVAGQLRWTQTGSDQRVSGCRWRQAVRPEDRDFRRIRPVGHRFSALAERCPLNTARERRVRAAGQRVRSRD